MMWYYHVVDLLILPFLRDLNYVDQLKMMLIISKFFVFVFNFFLNFILFGLKAISSNTHQAITHKFKILYTQFKAKNDVHLSFSKPNL